MRQIKLFMASPSDVKDERKLFTEVVESINRSRAHAENIHLEAVTWGKYAYPDAENPQEIINKLFNDAELLIVVFWNKFGAPTKTFPSGTMEEFSLAYAKRQATGAPSIKIYFRTPKALLRSDDLIELKKVLEFKEMIKDSTLYKEYKNISEFKSLLQEHINGWLTEYSSLKIKQTAKHSEKVLKQLDHSKTMIKEYFKDIEAKYEKNWVPKFSFGLKSIDDAMSSFEVGGLLLIGGIESSGKTSLALSLVNKAILGKIPTLYFGLRLSKKDITHRLLCSVAKIDTVRLNNGYLHESDWPKIVRAAGYLSEGPLIVDDNPMLSVSEIEDQIERANRSQKTELVVIDGINYITSGQEKLGRELRSIARHFKLSIVATVQLNRSSRLDQRPHLKDIDSYGDLRSESDIIFFTYRNEEPLNWDELNASEIILAKHPFVPTQSVAVTFMDKIYQFEEFEEINNIKNRKDA